jgi:integrase
MADRFCQLWLGRREVIMSEQLVKLRGRLSRDNKKMVYFVDFVDENGKRQRISLGHSNKRQADKERAEKEYDLRNGIVMPGSMKLSKFMEDSLIKTGKQIRQSSRIEYERAMNHFIDSVGDIDYQSVTYRHGELFLQYALDKGWSKATVKKRLREISRFFQVAVLREQLDQNPLKNVKAQKVPKNKIRIYSHEECLRLIKAASVYKGEAGLNWALVITLALTTGMRKSELLNTIWDDIDFGKITIEVQAKKETEHTWQWDVKDSDFRTLPLTEKVTQILANLQANHPEGYPYVLIPPVRYDRIQTLRKLGKWDMVSARLKIVNNFTRQFNEILELANIKHGTFHDLRRTALSNLIAQGLSEYNVMKVAGHAKFSTTHEFYLEVTGDIIEQTRQATEKGPVQNLAHFWHTCPSEKVSVKNEPL